MSKIEWKTVREFEDITYKKSNGVARIAFNRPDVRNAFRPKTTKELIEAFYDAQEDTSIGVVLLSAEGPSSRDGIWSCCSGGRPPAWQLLSHLLGEGTAKHLGRKSSLPPFQVLDSLHASTWHEGMLGNTLELNFMSLYSSFK